MNLGLWYHKGTHFDITSYSDMDFAGYQTNRKSTSDTYHFLGYVLVSWFSKKKNSVALSTTEVEYISIASCCAQILSMKHTLMDFCMSYEHVPIKCDNTSTINLSKNSILHSRVKHIDIRNHFLCDHMQNGTVCLNLLAPKNN